MMKLIGFPFSGGGLGHGDGSNLAPKEIVNQLEKNIFSNESGVEVDFDFQLIKLDEQNIEDSHELIKKTVENLNEKAILLGGDHSITSPAVEGFAKQISDFHFIVFDAHPDLMDDFRPPTQEDYLRVLIEKEIVKPTNCTIIGVRNWDKEEIKYLKEKNISYYTSNDIYLKGMTNIISEILSKIDKSIYLSIDIDVVDPVEAIGTGYIEHGGISSRELIYALQELKKTGMIKMVDLVEINPKKDINDLTSILGAKIVAELIDY